jgi:hypothetical protein
MIAQSRTTRAARQRKIKKTGAKKSAETAEASEEAIDAPARTGCIFLSLTTIDYPSPSRQKVSV